MKKQLTILVVLVLVLGLLTGGVVYALSRETEPEEDAQASADAVQVLAVQPQEITAITVDNAAGHLRLVREGDAMQVEGLSGIALADAQVEELLTACAAITATQELSGENLNLAEFGLESPKTKAQITLADGRSITLAAGMEAPAGMGQYAQVDGKLYLMSPAGLAPFERGQSDYVSLTVTPFLTQEISIQQITLQNTLQTEPVTLVYTPAVQPASSDAAAVPASWKMTAPVQQQLDTSSIDRWAQSIFGLAAQSAAALRPDAGAIAQFGLDEPQATLEVRTSDKNTIRLLAAKDAAGGCYLMLEGGAVVYSVSEGNIPWLTLTTDLMRGSIFPQTETTAIQTMRITSGTEHFELLNGSGTDSVNGTPMTQETLSALYQQALGLIPKQPTGEIKPTLDVAATIEILYADTARTVDRLELVPTGAGDLYMILNGTCVYVTAESQLNGLLQACRDAIAAA